MNEVEGCMALLQKSIFSSRAGGDRRNLNARRLPSLKFGMRGGGGGVRHARNGRPINMGGGAPVGDGGLFGPTPSIPPLHHPRADVSQF